MMTIGMAQGSTAEAAAIAAAPAFSLDFDPTLLFQEGGSLDPADDELFDKVLQDLDLELAADTRSSPQVAQAATTLGAPAAGAAGAAGLRELFGLHPPAAAAAAAWATTEQALPGQQQQPQQQGQQQLMQQQQQQQQLMAAAATMSPFVQPAMQQQPMFDAAAAGAGAQAAQDVQQWQQIMLLQQQQQLQALAAGMQQQQPMFTFAALPQQDMATGQAAAAGALPAALAAGMYPAAVWSYTLPGMPGFQHTMLPGMPGWLPPGTAAAPAAARGGRGGGRGGRGRGRGAAAGAGAAGGAAGAAATGVEKPKAPSQRFRERQKATIASLEAEVTQKLQELQLLNEENEMLKLRSAVLEAVTSGREYHMRVIQEHGPPRFESDGSPQSSGSLLHPSRSRGSLRTTSGPPADSDDAGSSPHASAHSCSTAAASGAGAGGAADGGAADVCNDPLRCASSQDGAVCTLEQQKATIRCIKQMSAPEIIEHWKRFLSDVSTELLDADQSREQQRLAAGEFGICGTRGPSDCASQVEAAKALAAAAAASASAAASGSADTNEDGGSGGDASAQMPLTCRWCGCLESADHLAADCQHAAAAPSGEQQQQDGDHVMATAEAAAAAAGGGGRGGAGNGVQQEQAAAASGGRHRSSSSGADAELQTADQRISTLVAKYSYLTKFVALLNPGVLYALLARNLDSGEPEPYTDAHWRAVVAALRLSKHQVTHILACAELYFSSLAAVVAERQALQQQLAATGGAGPGDGCSLAGGDSVLDQLTLLERLASNLKREHVLRIMLNCFVWGRCLTSVQFASTAVQSWPYFPDVAAMVSVMYEDAHASHRLPDDGAVFPHRVKAARQQVQCCQQQEQERMAAAAAAAAAGARDVAASASDPLAGGSFTSVADAAVAGA